MLYQKFGHYHWVHTINNAALVTSALISSEGDYERAICNVVMGGWDTDSNGATVGTIMGTMLGSEKLPSKWISPLNNKIRSSLKGLDNSVISDLAKRTANLSKFSSK
jgi:ADP-ribosylglycohydrolase